MATSSRPDRFRSQLQRLGAPRPRGPAGLWAIAGERLIALDAGDLATAVILVPTDRLLLTGVDLPLPSHRQRLAALPFALEDAVADDPETLHLALGQPLAPGRYLAAVVDHAVMRDWVALAADAGAGHASLVPDALALPVPAEGGWSVDLAGQRALVRAADGTGFAIHASALVPAWAAAGRPVCTAYGEPLPPAIDNVAAAELEATPLARRLASAPLDLRQGTYAPPRRTMPALARRLAIVAGAGILAHAGIATADTLVLGDLAQQREAETRALVEAAAPGRLGAGGDVVAVAADLLPEGGAAMPGRFVPLLNRTSAALQPIARVIIVRSIGFDDAEGSLTLDVEAPDVATLQRVEAVLSASGLTAVSGGAAAENGRATGSISVRDGAPA